MKQATGIGRWIAAVAGTLFLLLPGATYAQDAAPSEAALSAAYTMLHAQIAQAVRQAQAGDRLGVQGTLRTAIAESDLPIAVKTPFDDHPRDMFNPATLPQTPPSLPDAPALPGFVLKAQVLSGNVLAARDTARQQPTRRARLDAMSQVALVQAGRFELDDFFLPELRDRPPALYDSPVVVTRDGKKVREILKVKQIEGKVVVPALDASPLLRLQAEKPDVPGAYETLRQTLPVLENDTHLMSLLAELQAKLGDKQGAQDTLRHSVTVTRQDWDRCLEQKKDYCDAFRHTLKQTAEIQAQLGDREGAAKTRQYLNRNNLQTLLTLFVASTISLLIIFGIMARAR